MPALNFKKQFATKVEAMIKRQTIRKRREDGRDPKQGDTLYLYTGMRTKSCRKLGEATCKSSVPIIIDQEEIVLDGELMGSEAEECLAFADGFDSVTDFKAFFLTARVEQFKGRLIQW